VKKQFEVLQEGMIFYQVLTGMKDDSVFPAHEKQDSWFSFVKLDWEKICLAGEHIKLFTYQS